ncbi:hypothetical protein WJU23_08400 [Prosthecobacter sp. SYSU 5D2]|uniref:hypothetical protein n=1 Tax=Prosthecobacter sp. SYSU 5D2 TaxID=3134134 RepID=UPI0031FE7CC7
MKLPSENSTSGTLNWSWMVAGILLLLIGAVLFVTLVLAPVGIGMMILGVGVLIAAVVKAGHRQGPGSGPQSGV